MSLPPTDADEHFSPAPPKENNAWMLTVADLFSLMLTFFVLVYSMSTIQQEKWEAITQSLMQRLRPVDQDTQFTLPSLLSVDRAEFAYARNLDYLYRIISERREESADLKPVKVQRLPHAILLTLPENTLFEPGGTDLKPAGEAAVHALGELLSRIGNQVEIEGHTDPTPVQSKDYPSNWELSLARAVRVANVFRDAGYLYQLAISGMGSSRFQRSGSPSAQNQSLYARRVDVLIRENVAKN